MAISIDITLTNVVLICALWFGLKKLWKIFEKWQVEKMLQRWENTPKDKVILHALWRGKVLPSISPFALKLETYLRMGKIPYELDTKDGTGPKGRIPWISLNGTHVADSHLIIQYLNKKFSVDLNKNCSTEQVAAARACRVMLENHFLWGMIQFRWVENVSCVPQLLKMPMAFKLLTSLTAYWSKQRMNDNGMGKHTPTEVYQMTEDDLRTASTLLGNKKFFGGETACLEDAAIFGSVAQTVWGMPGSSFERLVNGELGNLKEYCERMKQAHWPDWESCLDKSQQSSQDALFCG